jgi:hypothetical protein
VVEPHRLTDGVRRDGDLLADDLGANAAAVDLRCAAGGSRLRGIARR